MSLLELRGIVSGYGQILALRGIDLSVEEGAIVALIGNNGAGKTTTLRTISGLIRPRQGSITFAGSRISGLAAHEIVRLGVAQVPEGRGIFGRLSVRENIEMGAFSRRDAEVHQDLDRVFNLFPRLRERVGQKGGTLSGGEQQMLAIARALMARPRLLLLDEPSMGLSPLLVETIFSTIQDIKRRGTTILLVEQNARMALQVASYAYVLESGTVALEGSAAALFDDPAVRKSYLGEEQPEPVIKP
jgi:branched-chain amino acid transport system ATP-binding protein